MEQLFGDDGMMKRVGCVGGKGWACWVKRTGELSKRAGREEQKCREGGVGVQGEKSKSAERVE